VEQRKKHRYQEDGLLECEFLYPSFDNACAERDYSGLDRRLTQQRIQKHEAVNHLALSKISGRLGKGREDTYITLREMEVSNR
jgi:hypothetical protein